MAKEEEAVGPGEKRRVIAAAELTEAEIELIARSEMPAEFNHLDAELLEDLPTAGTAADRVRAKLVDQGITVADAESAVRWARESGVDQ